MSRNRCAPSGQLVHDGRCCGAVRGRRGRPPPLDPPPPPLHPPPPLPPVLAAAGAPVAPPVAARRSLDAAVDGLLLLAIRLADASLAMVDGVTGRCLPSAAAAVSE